MIYFYAKITNYGRVHQAYIVPELSIGCKIPAADLHVGFAIPSFAAGKMCQLTRCKYLVRAKKWAWIFNLSVYSFSGQVDSMPIPLFMLYIYLSPCFEISKGRILTDIYVSDHAFVITECINSLSRGKNVIACPSLPYTCSIVIIIVVKEDTINYLLFGSYKSKPSKLKHKILVTTIHISYAFRFIN